LRALEYGMPPTRIRNRNGSFDDVLTNNASIQEVYCFPQMRPEKKQTQIELEADEKLLFILQANENQMEFGLQK
jgi:lysyl-tRNA synthetase class 2